MFDPTYVHRNFPKIRPEWLARRVEEVIDPDRPIIDPHHHIWDVPDSRYLVPELTEDIETGHNIRATVHVDCKSGYRTEGPEAFRPVGETEFIVRCAEEASRLQASVGHGAPRHPCAAMIGYADLDLGTSVRDVLQAHVDAGQGLFRGVRVRAAWHPDPAFQGPADGPPGDLLRTTRFREGFAQLSAMGLCCDMWVFHTQLADVAELAAAFPGTPMVLNHAGGPLGIGPYAGKRDEVFVDWSRDLRRLAQQQNVYVKLGGLAMPRIGFAFDAYATPPGSQEMATAWQPYIDTCLDAFGPKRCMFESNFPVDKGMTSYRILWNAFKRMASHLTEEEKQGVFHDTAAHFYALKF